MKLSKMLPQFERFPALFIASGEYEAHFFVAHLGEINEVETVKMTPRDEAKEKQMFTGKKAGVKDLSSFSHQGTYTIDLKNKFQRKMHDIIHDLILSYKLEEIYIFAPKYVVNRIMRGINPNDKKKIRMQFYKEYTKNNPQDLIRIFESEIEKMQESVTQSPESQDLFGLTNK